MSLSLLILAVFSSFFGVPLLRCSGVGFPVFRCSSFLKIPALLVVDNCSRQMNAYKRVSCCYKKLDNPINIISLHFIKTYTTNTALKLQYSDSSSSKSLDIESTAQTAPQLHNVHGLCTSLTCDEDLSIVLLVMSAMSLFHQELTDTSPNLILEKPLHPPPPPPTSLLVIMQS